MRTVDLGSERVVVVCVTYNSADVIAGLLESLPRGLAGLAWSLVIVDNASTDGVVAVARAICPNATVVETGRNGGYAAAINTGVAVAGDFTAVLVLNPDVRLGAGCVAELLARLRQTQSGVAVPRLTDRNGHLIESQRRDPTVLRALADAAIGASRAGRYEVLGEVVTDPAMYESQRETAWAEGSTLLISSECLERCGPWDERYFLYSEETEYMLRARDIGFATLYVPTASATHLEGSSASDPQLWALLVTNRVRLFRRRHSLPRTAMFWCAVTAREASRAVIGRSTNRAALRALVRPSLMRAAPGPDWLARVAGSRQRQRL